MDLDSVRPRAPEAAAVALAAAGVAALLGGVALLAAPVPAALGQPLPTAYRIILGGLGVVGGAMHLLAGHWAWRRDDYFRTTFATLVGTVLVQVTIPLDLVAIGLLVLGREQFPD